MKVYAGPVLPRDQVARIGGTFGVTQSVLLKTIEDTGVNTRVNEGDLEVLPGEQTVSVMFEFGFIPGSPPSAMAPCFVTFPAEAGHTYVADGEALRGGKWRCWIEDTQTKKRTKGFFRDPDATPVDSEEAPKPEPQRGPPH